MGAASRCCVSLRICADPLHEGSLRRSPLRGSGERCSKASSTPELLESSDAKSRDWDKQESKENEVVSERTGNKDFGRRLVHGKCVYNFFLLTEYLIEFKLIFRMSRTGFSLL
ncbi:hypothetical protein HHI36_012639 [Cryptolaemus montrouzieri]|uniref:Uncharacterized protein n=1 Tax=Cryptolaemus montrouzieri TaxID=559131 RepID=A0ABD2NFB2_9CUCU